MARRCRVAGARQQLLDICAGSDEQLLERLDAAQDPVLEPALRAVALRAQPLRLVRQASELPAQARLVAPAGVALAAHLTQLILGRLQPSLQGQALLRDLAEQVFGPGDRLLHLVDQFARTVALLGDTRELPFVRGAPVLECGVGPGQLGDRRLLLRGLRLQAFDLREESAGLQSGFGRQLGGGLLQGPDALVRFAQQLVAAKVADGGDGHPAGQQERRAGCDRLRCQRPASIRQRPDSQLVADRIEPPLRQAARSPDHVTRTVSPVGSDRAGAS